MQFTDFLQMLAALAVTLGLFGLGVWALRRWGPALSRKMAAVRSDRRLQVVEVLMLDPRTRLVLVRVDQSERLVIVGQGHIVENPK